MSRLIQSAGARVLVLPISGVATLITARAISTHYGTDAYAIFSLVASLPFLIPVADLGMGAALTNAAAALPEKYRFFRDTLQRTRVILFTVSAASFLISGALGALGWWGILLGLPSTPATNWGTAAAIAIFGIAIPGSLGARVLLGIGRNTVVVLIQGLTSLVTLSVVLVLVSTDSSIGIMLPGSMLGLLITNWLCSLVAFRSRPVLQAGHDTREHSGQPHRKVNVWSTAAPMLIISFALPLTFQSHRLVVSWTSDLHELAIYSAAAMVFLPVLSVVQVAGQSLWGDFAKARVTGASVNRLFVIALRVSTGLGIAGALSLLGLGPSLAGWATGFQLDPPLELFAAFALVVVLQAIHAPSGMYLTTAEGLRFQAVTTGIMAVVSLPLSVLLTSSLGAIGPVLATATALLTCQLIPCLLKARFSIKSNDARFDFVPA